MANASERGKRIFNQTERSLLKLRGSSQPDAVHSFRTTSRRLQVLLEELLPVRDRNQKKLMKSLNRIRRRAGQIRDIDVQLAALRSLTLPLEPRKKRQLTESLIELRRKEEKRLRKQLKKKTISDISKRIRRASKSYDSNKIGDPLAVARQMLMSIEKPSNGRIDEDLLHRYRLRIKRARYAVEFAPASSDAKQFITELKKLQDAVGHWHDWFTLTQTASQQLGDINQSPLMAALQNVTKTKYRDAVAKVSANVSSGSARVTLAVQRRKPDSVAASAGAVATAA
jgi:CHAD domain-containing protein